MYERLDTSNARNKWANTYPNAKKMHKVFTCSDHCPIIVPTHSQHLPVKAFPFHIQNFWCEFQNVKSIISKIWKLPHKGTNMYKIMRKLKLVKLKFKDQSKKHIGNVHDKLSKNAQKIKYVEERFLSNPDSYRFNSWMHRLPKQREKLLLFNQKY